MPISITPLPEPTLSEQVEHVGEAGDTNTSESTLSPKKRGKRRAQPTADVPLPPKKRRITSSTKEKSSPSTRKPSIKKKAPATVLATEPQGTLNSIVSSEKQSTIAESGKANSLPVVDDHAATTVIVPVSAVTSNLETPKRRRGRPKKVVDPGVLRSGPSRRRPMKRSATYVDNKGSQVQWKVIQPPKPSKNEVPVELSGNDLRWKPRIWASCKEDLLHVIPELSKAVNGLSWNSLETPMVLLEDQVSIVWSAEPMLTSVDLSITQEFLDSAKPLPTSLLHVVSVPEPEDEPMNLIQDVDFEADDLFGTLNSLVVNEPSVKVEEIAHSQEVFDGELLLLQYPDDSPQVQVPEVSPIKDIPTGARMVVKDYMMAGALSVFSSAESESQVIADKPADDQQAPAILPQDIETRVNSPANEFPAARTIANDHMSELLPVPSPIDSRFQVIVEKPTDNQPTSAGLPQDIEILVNAYIRGIPVVLVAPREKLPVGLHQDYGWVILGFYQVTSVTEETVRQEILVKGPSTRRLNWRFRLKWSPGGEYLLSDNIDAVSRPWWRKDSHPPQEDEVTNVSTEPYQKRRDEHIAAYPQLGDVGQNFNCLIPIHLLHMPGEINDDANFPSGWFCMDCGRLNPQVYFRHRVCTSKTCKYKPLERGYALELQKIRQPQDAMPFATPLQCPSLTEGHIDDIGTTTYDYSSALSVPILIKHIFTHNRNNLQQDAINLFRDIQTDVPLVQDSLGDTHFSYVVGVDFLDLGVKPRPWSEASGTVKSEGERLSHLGEQRGNFTPRRCPPHVTIIAWPTAGTSRKTQVLKARESAICVQCLGSGAVITICPMLTTEATVASTKSKLSNTRKVSRARNTANRKGKGEPDNTSNSLVQVSETPPEGKEKHERDDMSVSLVHGDILIISGHDVEFKVKRDHPTTVFMIVSVPLRPAKR